MSPLTEQIRRDFTPTRGWRRRVLALAVISAVLAALPQISNALS